MAPGVFMSSLKTKPLNSCRSPRHRRHQSITKGSTATSHRGRICSPANEAEAPGSPFRPAAPSTREIKLTCDSSVRCHGECDQEDSLRSDRSADRSRSTAKPDRSQILQDRLVHRKVGTPGRRHLFANRQSIQVALHALSDIGGWRYWMYRKVEMPAIVRMTALSTVPSHLPSRCGTG